MRTTVTLDRDVEVLLRRAMRERGESFKHVLNSALRDGLLSSGRTDPGAVRPSRQPVFKMGKALVDLTRANAIAEELEDAELARKMRRRR